jgi:hypothetical protein
MLVARSASVLYACPRSDTVVSADRLANVLNSDDDCDFLTELADIVEADGTTRVTSMPPLRAISELFAGVSTNGSRYYLQSAAAASFGDVLDAAKNLHAHGTVAYLSALSSLFPNSEVPRDDQRRARIVDELTLDTPQTQRSAFAELDARFEDSLPELALAVRRYAATHFDEMVAAISRASARPRGKAAAQVERETAAYEARATGVVKARNQKVDEFTDSFDTVPALPEGDDEELRAFCNAVAALSDAEWQISVRRFSSQPRKTKLAGRHVHTLPYETLYPRGAFDERVARPAVRLFAPITARAATIPERARDADGEYPFRAVALQAAREAWFAFSRRRWLGQREADVAALHTLLVPFAGLVDEAISPELLSHGGEK